MRRKGERVKLAYCPLRHSRRTDIRVAFHRQEEKQREANELPFKNLKGKTQQIPMRVRHPRSRERVIIQHLSTDTCFSTDTCRLDFFAIDRQNETKRLSRKRCRRFRGTPLYKPSISTRNSNTLTVTAPIPALLSNPEAVA